MELHGWRLVESCTSFLLLAGLSCNLFAFEEGGMRTLILSPIDRSKDPNRQELRGHYSRSDIFDGSVNNQRHCVS